MRKIFFLALVMSLGALWCVIGELQAQPQYYYRDLGSLGGADSRAYGINNNRQVVGRSMDSSGVTHAFSWTLNGGLQNLGSLYGSSGSQAWGINDSGQITGGGFDILSESPWQTPAAGSPLQPLSTLGGAGGLGYATNSSGVIAGNSSTPSGEMRASLWWTPTSTPLDLCTPGWSGGSALGINDAGVVVGWANPASGPQRPFWAFPGFFLYDIIDLYGGGLWGDTGQAWDINNMWMITGWARNAAGQNEAFWGSPFSAMAPLGGLGGVGSLGPWQVLSWAYGINEAFQIVGFAFDGLGQDSAFLYDLSTGVMLNLNDLVVNMPAGDRLIRALDINEAGEVVGYTQNGRAYLLSTDPSPSLPSP